MVKIIEVRVGPWFIPAAEDVVSGADDCVREF